MTVAGDNRVIGDNSDRRPMEGGIEAVTMLLLVVTQLNVFR